MSVWRPVRLATLLLVLASTPSLAQVTCPGGASTWTGSVSQLWGDPSNWTTATVPGVVPNVGADVCFAAGTPTTSLNTAASLNTFNVLSGSSLTLNGSLLRNLTISGGIQADGNFTFNNIPQVIPSATQGWIINGTSTFNSPLSVPGASAATTTITVTGAGDLTLNSVAPRGFQALNWGAGILTLTTNGLGSGTPITLTAGGLALVVSSTASLSLDNPVFVTTTGQLVAVDGANGIRHSLGPFTVAAGQRLEELPAGVNSVQLQVAGLTLGVGSTLLKQTFGGLYVNGTVIDDASSTLNLLIGLTNPTGSNLDEGLHFQSSSTVNSIISSTTGGNSAMIGADGATTLTLAGTVNLGSAGRLILIPRGGATILFGPAAFNAPGNPNDIQLRGSAGNTVEFTNSAVTANAVTVFDGLSFQTDAAPPPPSVTFSTTGGATWRVRNTAQTLTGALTLNAAGTVDTGTDLTITGTLSGTGALTKTGAGSLILGPGAHPHNGGIAVNAGTLVVNGSLAGEGTVSINNGGGVAGSGTLVSGSGPITVANGARYTPGSSGTGTLATNDLSLSDTSELTFTVGTPTTSGSITGALILDGTLNITQGAGFAQGTYTIFTSTGAITNNNLRLGSAPAGFSYDYQVSGTNVLLKVGPPATAVEMVKLDAVSDGSSTQVTWEAGTELRNLGYRLHREENGSRREVSGLIAGSALRAGFDPLAGRNYAFVDQTVRWGARYWVEAIDLGGKSQWFGPIDVRRGGTSGRPVHSATLMANLGRGAVVMSTGPVARQVDPPGLVRSWRDRSLEAQWGVAASAGAVKLLVRQDGVYRVGADQLLRAGLPPGTPLGALQLWAGGRRVAFRTVSANGLSLQSGDAIEFFGQAADTRFTDTRVYWVTVGLGRPLAMQPAPSAKATATGTSFLETLEVRDRTLHISALRNTDTDGFFGPPIIGTTPMRRVFSTPALAIVSGDPAVLEVGVQGLTDGAHTLDVVVNGLRVGTIQSVFQDVGKARFTLPPGILVPGDNTVALVGRTGTEIALELSQRLTYPRQYSLGGPLRFTAPAGTELVLSGADSSTHVLDITSAIVPAAVNAEPSSGGLRLTASGTGTRILYAYRDQDVLSPAIVANAPSSWHDADGADLVIIGQPELLTSLRPLADQRTLEGLKVALVDVADVYDEFSAGEKDALAIRSFLSTATQRWSTPPRFVLLAGAATYDPRGWLGRPELDQVPTLLVQTRYQETASDDGLVIFDESIGPTLAIGRLPMSNAADMDGAVAKILGRKLGGPQDTLLLVRDRDGTIPFSAASAEVRSALSGWKTDDFARGADDSASHSALLDALRAGPIAVDYQGHGAEDFWAGRMLATTDADALASTGKTALVVAATCLNGYFVDIGRESLASAMLRIPGGGAWGMWASSALTLPTEHGLLSKTLLSAALNEGLTLGEATLKAKQAVTDPDVRATFHLLGDPSARAVQVRSSALATTGTPRSGALGCSTPGDPVAFLVPLVLGILAISVRRRRSS